jgi:hypothetical protein
MGEVYRAHDACLKSVPGLHLSGLCVYRDLSVGGLKSKIQCALGDAIIEATRPTMLNTIGQSR